jgi:hypothetical protein
VARRERDYVAERERRSEAARARGYRSFDEQRNAEKFVADNYGLTGRANLQNRREMAAFMHNYADGDKKKPDLERLFKDWTGAGDDDPMFFRWLSDLYGVI